MAGSHPINNTIENMKITSNQVGTGKLGNAVYSQNSGVCIARQYNPKVTNPSTESQVEKRSAFKLMSQLSASLKESIAIRKDGLKTARNQFMSINYDATRVIDNIASINLNKVQLTKSNRGFVDFTADRTSGTKIAVQLAENISGRFDKVVYAAFVKEADGSLVAHDSIVVETAGADGYYPGELKPTTKAVVVYSYGIALSTAGARTAFGNMQAPTAEQVAKLLTTSSEAYSGSLLSKTKGLTMLEGENTGDSDSEEHFVVSVSASGNGSVSGGGRFVAGQTCTLHATPVQEASFVAWKRNSASGAVLSTNATYSFEVDSDIVIVGVFQGGPTPQYQITASVDPVNAGSVSGTGSKAEGSTATLTFTPAGGSQLVFDGWYENGTKVSAANPYSFTVEHARTLVAKAVEPAPSNFSRVKFGSVDWDHNLTGQGATGHVTGSYANGGANTILALVQSNAMPSVGADLMTAGTSQLSDSSFDINATMAAGYKYWLVAGTAGANSHVVVADVFEYSLVTQGED